MWHTQLRQAGNTAKSIRGIAWNETLSRAKNACIKKKKFKCSVA